MIMERVHRQTLPFFKVDEQFSFFKILYQPSGSGLAAPDELDVPKYYINIYIQFEQPLISRRSKILF